ncbi:hypothetical protein [Geminocystis sp. NIES-3709]|uniref:hypothetical protein n=1 Tax=Geminocystis sp. NIES-3709 TaxID=1617448 RepID=UPI0005FC67AE|nr:hypothetical protein [Geminocystis sp. NIES-3709]BAQ65469.1 hypothetical protein GM3709_2234 [Geminocystis sp. NIES-3709]
MKKHHLINLFLSGLITTQIVTISHVVKAAPINFNQQEKILTAQNTPQLTSEKITEIMASIENAEKSENLSQLLDFLTPYTFSTISTESDNTTIITTLEGKDEHEYYLSNSFKRVKEREYLNSYSSIKVTEDGQMALVTRIRATNITTEEGQNYLSLSTDKIRFALIDNQPKIVNIEVKGWLEQRP